jgi:hypothetical protein
MIPVRVTPNGGSDGDQHRKAEIHCRAPDGAVPAGGAAVSDGAAAPDGSAAPAGSLVAAGAFLSSVSAVLQASDNCARCAIIHL